MVAVHPDFPTSTIKYSLPFDQTLGHLLSCVSPPPSLLSAPLLSSSALLHPLPRHPLASCSLLVLVAAQCTVEYSLHIQPTNRDVQNTER